MVQPIVLHDYISQERAAELLGVHPLTIRRWMRDGKLQAVIVGGHRVVPQWEVDRLIRERTEQEAEAA